LDPHRNERVSEGLREELDELINYELTDPRVGPAAVSEGTGEIECDGKMVQVGPGAIMYCAGNTLHGITNTGKTSMTFYWSKWIAKGHAAG